MIIRKRWARGFHYYRKGEEDAFCSVSQVLEPGGFYAWEYLAPDGDTHRVDSWQEAEQLIEEAFGKIQG
jgi:hypothetical protein